MTAEIPNPYDSPREASHTASPDLRGNTAVITAEIMVKAHQIHQHTRSLILNSVVVVICVCFAAVGVWFWCVGQVYAGAMLCGLAAVMMFQVLLSGRRLRRTINKQYEQMGKQQFVVTYQASPEYLHLTTEDSDSRINWSDFRKWKEVEELILAYRHDRLFQVIPMNQLDNELQRAIRDGLAAHSRHV